METDTLSRGIPSKNDVLITTEAPLGNVCCVPELEKFALAQRIINLKIDRIYLHGKFLMYQILSSDFQNDLIKNATGTTVKGIKASKLKEIAIKVPPRAEQERIVRKIETCFEKIDSTEQNLTKIETLLEKYRESLLTKAFRGELIPQDPNDEPARVLLEKIRAERAKNQKGKKKAQEFAPVSDDEKPFDIPESWEWVRLGDLCKAITYGATASASQSGEFKFLRITDLTENGVNWSSVPWCTIKGGEKYLLKSGDIVVARTGGTVGKTHRLLSPPDNAIYASYLINISILPSLNNSAYFSLFLKSPFYWKQIEEKAQGAAQPNVNATKLADIPVPLPPIDEQMRIANRLQNSMAQLEKRKNEISNSMRLISLFKESILKKAFEGSLVAQIDSEGTGHELLEMVKKSKCTEKKGEYNEQR